MSVVGIGVGIRYHMGGVHVGRDLKMLPQNPRRHQDHTGTTLYIAVACKKVRPGIILYVRTKTSILTSNCIVCYNISN